MKRFGRRVCLWYVPVEVEEEPDGEDARVLDLNKKKERERGMGEEVGACEMRRCCRSVRKEGRKEGSESFRSRLKDEPQPENACRVDRHRLSV